LSLCARSLKLFAMHRKSTFIAMAVGLSLMAAAALGPASPAAAWDYGVNRVKAAGSR